MHGGSGLSEFFFSASSGIKIQNDPCESKTFTRVILYSFIGFKIPCKVNYISDVDMGFKTKVSDYGLNNLLIELYLCINVKNELMSPSSFYTFGESYELIIASKIVMGRIPNYLGDTIEKSSSIVSS